MKFAVVAALMAAAGAFVDVSKTQWDLKVYTACAQTLASGGDPYSTPPLVDGARFQCLYPPLMIDLYRPFARPGGERAWAALKVLSLALMLWLWRDCILRPGKDHWRLLFAACAYGSPFWSDFRAGNAGSFEHLILWGALAAFIAERDLLFAALVAAAAQPKLLPLAFLPLVVAKPRPNPRALLVGGALAAAALGLTAWLHPGLSGEFYRQLMDPHQSWRYERGPNNCAFIGLVQHALETAWHDRSTELTWVDRDLAAYWALRVGAVWTAFIAAVTAWSLSSLWRGPGNEKDKRRRAVLLYAAAYALVAPRLKDYSFLLLIPPTLAALESDAPLPLRGAILLFAALDSTKALAERLGFGVWSLFAGYFKLYAAMLVWYVLAFPTRTRQETA